MLKITSEKIITEEMQTRITGQWKRYHNSQKENISRIEYMGDVFNQEKLVEKIVHRVLNNRVKTRKNRVVEYTDGTGKVCQEYMRTKPPVLQGLEQYLQYEDVKQESYVLAMEFLRRNHSLAGAGVRMRTSREYRKYIVSLYFRASFTVALRILAYIVKTYKNIQEVSSTYMGENGEEYSVECATTEYHVSLFAWEQEHFIDTMIDVAEKVKTPAQRVALRCILEDIGRQNVSKETYAKTRRTLRDCLAAQ